MRSSQVCVEHDCGVKFRQSSELAHLKKQQNGGKSVKDYIYLVQRTYPWLFIARHYKRFGSRAAKQADLENKRGSHY